MCLKSICDDVLNDEDLKANIDEKTGAVVTHCNQAVDRICKGMGYNDFHGGSGPYLANKIVDIMDKNWIVIDGKTACELAVQGILIVAGKKDYPNGHVSVVYPNGRMSYSASWRKMVPDMANIGYTSGIMPCSRCFKQEPLYYKRVLT